MTPSVSASSCNARIPFERENVEGMTVDQWKLEILKTLAVGFPLRDEFWEFPKAAKAVYWIEKEEFVTREYRPMLDILMPDVVKIRDYLDKFQSPEKIGTRRNKGAAKAAP